MSSLLQAAGLLRRFPFHSSSLSRDRISGVRAAFLSLGFALAAGGCATTADCGGDWYGHGWSDGRYGAFAQADLYARRCPAVDAAEYNRGWRDGNSARPSLGGM